MSYIGLPISSRGTNGADVGTWVKIGGGLAGVRQEDGGGFVGVKAQTPTCHGGATEVMRNTKVWEAGRSHQKGRFRYGHQSCTHTRSSHWAFGVYIYIYYYK